MYEKLKELIHENGYSQESYTKKLYIDRSNWFKRLTGKTKWTEFETEKIKEELNYDVGKRND